jgi:tetratricopeptide (TPR) repeat protein
MRCSFLILSLLLSVLCCCIQDAIGRPLDQDYYIANDSTELEGLLKSVDFNHTKKAYDWIGKGTGLHYAVSELRYTLDTFPNHPEALQLIGLVARLQKNPSLAVPYFEKALRLFPQYAATHLQFGIYLIALGNTDKGIHELKRTIEIDQQSAVAHAWLAKAYAKNGNLELARQAAKKARELGYKEEILDEVQKKD